MVQYQHYSETRSCLDVGCRHQGRCITQDASNQSWCECDRGYRGEYCEKETYTERKTYNIEFQVIGKINDYRRNRTYFEEEISTLLLQVYQGVTGNGLVNVAVNSVRERQTTVSVKSTLSFILFFDQPSDARSLNLPGVLLRQLKMGTLGPYNVTTQAFIYQQVQPSKDGGFFGSKAVIQYMTITAAALLLLFSMVFLACAWLTKRRNQAEQAKKSQSVEIVSDPVGEGHQGGLYEDLREEPGAVSVSVADHLPTPPPRPKLQPSPRPPAREATLPIQHARRLSYEPFTRYSIEETEYINSPPPAKINSRAEKGYALRGKGQNFYEGRIEEPLKQCSCDEADNNHSLPTTENEYVPMTGSIKTKKINKNEKDHVEYIIMKDDCGKIEASDRGPKLKAKQNDSNENIYINNNPPQENAYLELIEQESNNNFFQFPRPGSRLHASMVESFEKTAMMKSPRSRLPASARSSSKSPPRSRSSVMSSNGGYHKELMSEEIPGVANLCKVDYNRGNGTPHPKQNNIIKACTLPSKLMKKEVQNTPNAKSQNIKLKCAQHSKAPSDSSVVHLWRTPRNEVIQTTPSTKRYCRQKKTDSLCPPPDDYGPPLDKDLGIHLTPRSKRYNKKATTTCPEEAPSFGGFKKNTSCSDKVLSFGRRSSGVVNMAFADDPVVDLSPPITVEENGYDFVEEYTEIDDDECDSPEEYQEINDFDEDEEDPRKAVLLPIRIKKKKSLTDELPAYFAKIKPKTTPSGDIKACCKKLTTKSLSDDYANIERRKLPPIPSNNLRHSIEK
ncbi:uncharacterized protein LOC106158371 isoform X2 [Lingula anatina]|uniref:Uncharacterized protein LOC106158371 isoform X2 n=1 Tax=Lingula anatina TaxID=7574 RepID=A0A1S3HUP6_LINAN|nr:uncharacterized protein LOC106158371 isoform X2 [Lingula anatina]|eukprot:XP_013389765.1 uncharacterized protein LOC106158371 isoform X2 [Lingula anatina]